MPTQRPETPGRALQLPRSIRGSLLRDFAATTSRRRMSVIVLPCLPKVSMTSPKLDIPAAQRATAALKRELAKLALLDRSRSVSVFSGFVLEVTPRQLRLLAQTSAVQSIHPNVRRHQLV